MAKYAIFDTETTGLDPERHRVIGVGLILFEVDPDHQVQGYQEWESYIRPIDGEVDDAALKVNNLTLEFLQDQPLPSEVWPRVQEMLAGDDVVLVAHNAPFDMAFLNAELRRNGLAEWRGNFICTRSIAQLTLGWALRRFRLMDVCSHFRIPYTNGHDALNDTRMTKEILTSLLTLAEHRRLDPLNVLVPYKDKPIEHCPDWARIIRVA